MLNDRILLLGGTGFIGKALHQYLISNSFKHVVQFNHIQYDASVLLCNAQLLNYIQSNNITTIVDFTRTKMSHILSQKLLLSKLSTNVIYVNISSYVVNHTNMFLDSYEYIQAKIQAEKNIRKTDYNIRLPRVITTIDQQLLLNLKADKDINCNYIYINYIDDIVKNIVDILKNNKPGTYCADSIKLFFK